MNEPAGDAGEGHSKSPAHQQGLLSTEFLGAIPFTGLVLVLSLPDNFDKPVWILPADVYFDALTLALALTSVFFIFGSVLTQVVAAGTARERSRVRELAIVCFRAGFVLTLIDLPLLLLAVQPVVAFLVGLIEVSMFVVWVILNDLDSKRSQELSADKANLTPAVANPMEQHLPAPNALNSHVNHWKFLNSSMCVWFARRSSS